MLNLTSYNNELEANNSIYRLEYRQSLCLVDIKGGLVQGDLDESELEDFVEETIDAEQSNL